MDVINILTWCAQLPPTHPLCPVATAIIESRGAPMFAANDGVVIAGVFMTRWQAAVAELRLQDLARTLVRI